MELMAWIQQADLYFQNGLVAFLVTSLAVLVFAYVVRTIARYSVRLLIKRGRISPSMITFVSHIFLALLYIITALAVFMQVKPFREYAMSILAGSGVAVLVVGFAAQETLSNLIAGIFISLFQPFVVGDTVVLSEKNIAGVVEDINLRHTVLRTAQNNRLMIPNSTMNTAVVENKDAVEKQSQNYVSVSIDFDSDVQTAMNLMVLAARENTSVIRKDEVRSMVLDVTPLGTQIRLAFWTSDFASGFETSASLRLRILELFNEHKIGFAHYRAN